MAHYAFLDQNNIVTEVIPGKDESDLVDGIASWEQYYGEFRGQVCKRTSYNTREGKHLFEGIPYRLNYAGVGDEYREDLDGFVKPRPFDSWILNEETGTWYAPVAYPNNDTPHIWNEETLSWTSLYSETE